ncbi:MAG: prepilin-type N-terminal cleavage/methylation domain-containing protein, partial [Phycisphaerales bacterium]|nr:prepilin-type N-terminal cleavage/methylation domain-containing protein [Phycisphaerales bacterium]
MDEKQVTMPRDAKTISPPGVHALACFGFTLVELILVLVIATVAVSIAAPSLTNFVRSRDLTNTANRFVAATRYARTEAMAQATVYRININKHENRWWLTKAD